MQKQVVMSALIVALAGGAAQAEDTVDMLAYRLGDQLAFTKSGRGFWNPPRNNGTAECKETLAKLAALKAPATTEFTLPYDGPLLKAGKHPISAAAATCDLAATEILVEELRSGVGHAAVEVHNMKKGLYWHASSFNLCRFAWENLMKAGVPATYVVLENTVQAFEAGELEWKGTIGDLKKQWCDAGDAEVAKERDKVEGPYKKVLKADKLKMVLTENGASVNAYIVPGGGSTDNPQKLASAKVWLSETQSINSNREVCRGGGEVVTVTRYQFDAAHKLVKTTSKLYCGRPPKNAYK